MKLPTFRPRIPMLGLALGACLGIALADWLLLPLTLTVVATLIAALITCWRPRTWICCGFIILAFAIIHEIRETSDAGKTVAIHLASEPSVATVRGVVISEPDVFPSRRGETDARFRLKIDFLRLGDHLIPAKRCMIRWKGKPPLYGDLVEIHGSAAALRRPRNPGEFDSAAWLQRLGIHFEVVGKFTDDCVVVGNQQGPWHGHFAVKARKALKHCLERGLEDSPQTSALIESMVLGLRSETPLEMKELFQKTGTLHLFAVSGLNVAMLAGIAWFVLKILRVSRRVSVFLIIPLLFAYALITGLSASCVRATLMTSFVLGGFLLDRRSVALNSICAAAVLILAWDTNELFSPGFQFSFVLVLVIFAIAGRISKRAEVLGLPDSFLPRQLWSRTQRWQVAVWKGLSAAAGVTLAAWLGSLIFTAGYFHLFSVASIPANFLAVPLAFLILALGLSAVLLNPISPSATVMFNNANWLLAKVLVFVVELFSRVPGGHVYVEAPDFRSQPACEITVFDFGDGGSAHIRAGRGDWLIDCGGVRNYTSTLLPYLRSRGVNRLNGLIFSHGDASHLGNWTELRADFEPAWIAEAPLLDRSPVRKKLHGTLAKENYGKRLLSRGDILPLSPEVHLRVLYPPPGLSRSTSDDKALVLMLQCSGRRILFVSDAGFRTENWLLENEPDLHADVMIKGRHAKDVSGTPDFLSKVAPQFLISTSPPFGSSTESNDDFKFVESTGTKMMLQQDTGAVCLHVSPDQRIEVETFLSGENFELRK